MEGNKLVNMSVDTMVSIGILAFIVSALAFMGILYDYKANEDLARQERRLYSEWSAYNNTVITGVEVLDLITKNIDANFVVVYDSNNPTGAYITAAPKRLLGSDYYNKIIFDETIPAATGSNVNQVISSSMYVYTKDNAATLMSSLQDNLLTAKADSYSDYQCNLVITEDGEVAGIVCVER